MCQVWNHKQTILLSHIWVPVLCWCTCYLIQLFSMPLMIIFTPVWATGFPLARGRGLRLPRVISFLHENFFGMLSPQFIHRSWQKLAPGTYQGMSTGHDAPVLLCQSLAHDCGQNSWRNRLKEEAFSSAHWSRGFSPHFLGPIYVSKTPWSR